MKRMKPHADLSVLQAGFLRTIVAQSDSPLASRQPRAGGTAARAAAARPAKTGSTVYGEASTIGSPEERLRILMFRKL